MWQGGAAERFAEQAKSCCCARWFLVLVERDGECYFFWGGGQMPVGLSDVMRDKAGAPVAGIRYRRGQA